MFENLTERLGESLRGLTGQSQLTEDNIRDTLREVRKALLEADVALSVVKDFTEQVKEKALGAEVLKSLNPGQAFVKIVNDEMIHVMGDSNVGLDLAVKPPAVIMMAGLQGAGKTTSVGKLAKFLQEKHKKKVLLASLDVQRPAAQEQLAVLGTQAEVATLPIEAGQKPVAITKRALEMAKREGYDVVLLDTAGRLHIDEALMQELKDEYTIIIVTHNMQQAARVSDRTAFFVTEVSETSDTRTGLLVEYDRTEKIFSNPGDERTENYVTGRFG